MKAIEEMREARRRIRDRAALHARLARRLQADANKAKEKHFQKLYGAAAKDHHAKYIGLRWASSSLSHAMRRAEEYERKADLLTTLRAMG